MGSNDYFAPQPLNYLSYFRPPRKHRAGRRGRSEGLRARLEADGWVYLANRKASLSRDATAVEVVGIRSVEGRVGSKWQGGAAARRNCERDTKRTAGSTFPTGRPRAEVTELRSRW